MRNSTVSVKVAIGFATTALMAACSSANAEIPAGSSTDGTSPGAPPGQTSTDGGSPNSSDARAPNDAGTPSEPETCGLRSSMRGLTKRTLTIGGLTRTFQVYVPPALDPKASTPFVYVFHGYTMSGQEMHDITRYQELADKEGIAVVFPDGQGGAGSYDAPWNVEDKGEKVCGAGEGLSAAGDDFAFMDAMKAEVSNDQCLDAAHVYVTGFSMGGYFSHHAACHRADIRAAAPHSGGAPKDLSTCTGGAKPIIIFHGTSDSIISAGCADPHSTAESGFPASATLWAAKNGCKTTATAIPTDGATGGKGTCYLYDGCPANAQVELCTFAGMDHCWAGGNPSGAGGDSACPTYADATALQWAFFKKYAY